MNTRFTRQNILKWIDTILEHNYFKIICISIITSFVLFNGISYFKNSFIKKEEIIQEKPIKINIGNSKDNLSQVGDQVLVHVVESGETLTKILFDLGLSENDVTNILDATKRIMNPADILLGQKLVINYKTIIEYENSGSVGDMKKNLIRKAIVSRISLSPDPEINMIVERQKDSSYVAVKTKKELFKKISKYSGTIKNGLFIDATELGASPKIVIEMINLYGFAVDFQRDLRSGDNFEVLFEEFYDKDGEKIKDGRILYSSLELKTKSNKLEAYLYEYAGSFEYFNKDGNSIKRSLLVTPINGARISSGFGMRRHPILGFRKKHKGLDFAAPTGTPILAAGNGSIKKIGYSAGNGNYIFLQHTNKTFETVYIHMSRFARNMKKGVRVTQGQVIGYVGATGLAKGPHLHYEVRKNGESINPANFKGTANIILQGNGLYKFKLNVDQVDHLRRNIPNNNSN